MLRVVLVVLGCALRGCFVCPKRNLGAVGGNEKIGALKKKGEQQQQAPPPRSSFCISKTLNDTWINSVYIRLLSLHSTL